MRGTYQSYSTNIKLLVYFGIQEEIDFIDQIPPSTKDGWKNLDINKIFGLDHKLAHHQLEDIKIFAKQKKYHRFSRAIFNLEKSMHTIFKTLKTQDGKTLFKNCKETIVNVVEQVKDTIGFERALDLFQMSYQQYWSWKKKTICKTSPFGICRRIYYNQLTEKEVNIIKQYLLNPDYVHWKINQVYWQMINNGAAYMNKSTFYKYAKILGFTKNRRAIKKPKYPDGKRATQPLRSLHMDLTHIRTTDNARVNISFVVDNFSRAILGWKASLHKSSEFIMDNLKEVFEKYKLTETSGIVDLIVDNGNENKGHVDDFLRLPHVNMQKLIAMMDVAFSNSMVESVIKKMKYDFLFRQPINNFNHLNEFLSKAVKEYNKRPLDKLFGLTPNEALAGYIPNQYQYTESIKNAAKQRILTNIHTDCQKCQ